MAAKLIRFLLRAPVNIFLSLLGVLWLVPTLGLFLTSILPAQAFTAKGWWQIFSKPSLATWSNYRAGPPQPLDHALARDHGRDRGRRTR